MESSIPKDKSNGYEALAERYLAMRNVGIGARIVREWGGRLAKSSHVLDLGCGNGEPITAILSEQGHRVFGVDAAPKMIAEFRRRFPRAEAECCSAEEFDYKSHRFDAAIACGLIFLLQRETQVRVLAGIGAALRDGGELVFTAPRDTVEWKDTLTGGESRSLGLQEYVAVMGHAGLRLQGTRTDEGDNHYYFAIKGA